MISLFILNTNIRGIKYGIGTYLEQLIVSLLKYNDVDIYVVNYLSETKKEFTINLDNNRITEIIIPKPLTKLNDEKHSQKYANRIIDFLIPLIDDCANLIFLVNTIDSLLIVKYLKSRVQLKIISIVHSAQWQYIFNGNESKFNKALIERKGSYNDMLKLIGCEKELYEVSDKIVSVTKYMKEFITRYFNINEEKIKIVPNGIDNNRFRIINSSQRSKIKESLGFDREEKIVLYSGRLDKGKGIYFLLDAFTEVVKKNHSIRLVLAGDDSGPDKISRYLNHCTNMWSKVTFTGFVDYTVMIKLYQIADVGIIPSVYDHCPYVALEMIGYNIPLIISDTEGLNEMLSKNQSVYLTKSINREGDIIFNKKEIADAILSLINNGNSRTKKLTSKYQNLIKTRFSNKLMAQEMHSLLQTL